MPVPTLVTDLSTTLASNSPSGSDNVFPSLDDYLRAMSGFIASIRDNSGNGWVSPYLPLTYSAGTANGVAYLNGSKVVTTGSGLVFDGSNLGLGVTPDAWQSGYRSFTMQYGGSLATTTGIVQLGQNYFYNASSQYIYRTPDFASFYRQQSGQHQWFTAPSGTAGNAISFTQAMTLNAGGVLTLGTNIPALNVGSSAVSTGDCSIEIGPGRTGNGNAYIDLTGDTTYADYGLRIIRNNGGANTASSINHRGTGSLQLTCEDSGLITFATNATERARITSGGDLLVGLSSPAFVSTRLEVQAATNNNALGARTTQNNYAPLMAWNSATTGDNLFQYFYTEGTLTLRGSIDYNRAGGLVRYNTTSDYRAKDIIGPVQNPGATIDALKVYEGKMKGATQSRPMLVAHEAQAVAPYAVSGIKDEVNEDGSPKFQQIDVSSLVPLLLAEIQSLRARVAALEQA